MAFAGAFLFAATPNVPNPDGVALELTSDPGPAGMQKRIPPEGVFTTPGQPSSGTGGSRNRVIYSTATLAGHILAGGFSLVKADAGVLVSAVPVANEHGLPINFGPGRGRWIAKDLSYLNVEINNSDDSTAADAAPKLCSDVENGGPAFTGGFEFVAGPDLIHGDIRINFRNRGPNSTGNVDDDEIDTPMRIAIAFRHSATR